MDEITDGRTLAQAMVDTVRESLLVLDRDLRVVAASRSFYSTFQTTPGETVGHLVYDLGSGAWNSPALRELLERIIPEHGVMNNFEVEQDFPGIGKRTMLLNARKVFYQGDLNTTLLLAIEDITDRRAIERQLQSLSEQKDMLLSEMSHRVANSLQIIASILLLKARSVQSEETRGHLEDAHRRVMSVASLQQHLQATGKGEEVEIGSYLSKLCDTLTGSMVREKDSVVLKVMAGAGTATSEQAVSIGLIVTELVINALKHAFPVTMKSGAISVDYEVKGNDWKLSVSDNGVGMPKKLDKEKAGLGTTLVKALAHQLQAQVETVTSDKGTTVSITHATF
ncbi:MAG: histidine kinase dimerization/phosphoacceptor domain -containing protein [Aestuariivirga sp.]